MSSITINNDEIDAVAFALSHIRANLISGTGPPTVTYRQAYDRSMPLQNREALRNHMTYLFATDGAGAINATIAATITNDIWNQPAVLGGLCYQNMDPGCPGPTAFHSGSIFFGSAEAEMLVTSNTLRSGYITKTCLALVEGNATALQNVLAKGGVVTSDAITVARLNSLWKAFFPYIDSASTFITSLYDTAHQSTASNIEVWKDVLAVFCQSTMMERY
jgi:hypothetical protein